MRNQNHCTKQSRSKQNTRREGGTALIIAILIMSLLAIFSAAALSRVTTDIRMSGNDYEQSRAFYAALASLELMTRNKSKIYITAFSPTEAQLGAVEGDTPPADIDGDGRDDFDYTQVITPAVADQTSETVNIDTGDFQGLVSIRDTWTLTATATALVSGTEVALTRTFYNHRIPIFQFGIFYNDDLEVHPGPLFNFGGRVHTNGALYVAADVPANVNNPTVGIFFNSRVTAVNHIVIRTFRNGDVDNAKTGIYVSDGTGGVGGTFRQVSEGSVTNGPDTAGTDADVPDGVLNNNWGAFSAIFNGNLRALSPVLRLPLETNGNDPIQIIKRGTLDPNDEEVILRGSRFANKPCIRVSLSDSQALLPGGNGGVRLDGDSGNTGAASDAANGSKGYDPPALIGAGPAYDAVRFNGHRVNTNGREVWIKIEAVDVDIDGSVTQVDYTTGFLALGVTKRQTITGPGAVGDTAGVFLLQQFGIEGSGTRITGAAAPAFPSFDDAREAGVTNRPVYFYNGTAPTWHYVQTEDNTAWNTPANNCAYTPSLAPVGITVGSLTNPTPPVAGGGAWSRVPSERFCSIPVNGNTRRIVPFPIKMFDSREGVHRTDMDTAATYPNSTVPRIGVMGILEIDMTNLRAFLNNTNGHDGRLPGNLDSTDIDTNGGDGVIVYVSDRRGDADNDGMFDMENVYIAIGGFNDDVLEPGEDVMGPDDTAGGVHPDNTLNVDYANEAARYNDRINTAIAAFGYPTNAAYTAGSESNVLGDRLFRRGVRLVRGAQLYGDFDTGLTIATENPAYIQGNYNSTGVVAPAAGVSADTDYPPQSNAGAPNSGQVPAAVIADAVTILSNAYLDVRSFASPFNATNRVPTQTTIRTALMMGDTKSARAGNPAQDDDYERRRNGGVHNFKRFLEAWSTALPCNYCGSLINLWNSRQATGTYKAGGSQVYGAPRRNWIFDSSFLDPARIPPGTPFFQYVQLTGFRQATF